MDGRGIKLEELIEYGSKEAIIQNLKDAGCSQDTIKCCIACLDYLVYQIDRCCFK